MYLVIFKIISNFHLDFVAEPEDLEISIIHKNDRLDVRINLSPDNPDLLNRFVPKTDKFALPDQSILAV